jgi:hypothetical protein
MTSIDWLITKLHNKQYGIFDGIPILSTYEIYAKAKEMHKQEIIDAWKMGRYDSDEIVMTETFYAEKYYNQTFKPCQ